MFFKILPIFIPLLLGRDHSSNQPHLGFPSSYCHSLLNEVDPKSVSWSVNTSNPMKADEFKSFFNLEHLNLSVLTHHDLAEILSDPITVLIHKASQIDADFTIVEDSSLMVDGEDVGVNIKWMISRLPEFLGKKAELTILLGFSYKDVVFVFKGSLKGKIVEPRGPRVAGAPMSPFFQPDGSCITLAELETTSQKSLEISPRYRAMKNLILQKQLTCAPKIKNWKGTWQRGGS